MWWWSAAGSPGPRSRTSWPRTGRSCWWRPSPSPAGTPPPAPRRHGCPGTAWPTCARWSRRAGCGSSGSPTSSARRRCCCRARCCSSPTDDVSEQGLDEYLVDRAGEADVAERVDGATAERLCPALAHGVVRTAGLVVGADIDTDALHQGYLRGLRARGGEVRVGAPAERIERVGTGWRVHLAARRPRCWTPGSSWTPPGRGPMSSPGWPGCRRSGWCPSGGRSRRCACRIRRGCAGPAQRLPFVIEAADRLLLQGRRGRPDVLARRRDADRTGRRASRIRWTSRWRWSGWRRSPGSACGRCARAGPGCGRSWRTGGRSWGSGRRRRDSRSSRRRAAPASRPRRRSRRTQRRC